MNNNHIKNIEATRTKAIVKLLEISEYWDDDMYCDSDFMIDMALRYALNLPPRDTGKPAYDRIEL